MAGRKIGLYGGSFNPVHLGHLWVSLFLLEECKLDHVFFIPANISPFKQGQSTIDAQHRLHMLKLALDDVPDCSILENELHRKGLSYTIDTVKELLDTRVIDSEDSVYLILGKDQVQGFDRWKDVHELVQLVKPLIAVRAKSKDDCGKCSDPHIQALLEKGMYNTPMIDVSSTAIRKRLTQGLYCGHLVPYKVLQYIYRYKLYTTHE